MSLKKKLLTVVIGAMVALSLAGCGEKINNPTNNSPKTYKPGSIEDKILNEGELNADDIQKAVEDGIIELN